MSSLLAKTTLSPSVVGLNHGMTIDLFRSLLLLSFANVFSMGDWHWRLAEDRIGRWRTVEDIIALSGITCDGVLRSNFC